MYPPSCPVDFPRLKGGINSSYENALSLLRDSEYLMQDNQEMANEKLDLARCAIRRVTYYIERNLYTAERLAPTAK